MIRSFLFLWCYHSNSFVNFTQPSCFSLSTAEAAPHHLPVIALYLLRASINDCRSCHTNQRERASDQLSGLLLLPSLPTPSEGGSDSFKAAARNAFPQLYSPPNSSLPRFRELFSEGHETSRTCHVIRPRRFVASLKLCLGLRIAAGRTSGRAWDFSWQFVVSELPGKKRRAVQRARVTSFPSDILSVPATNNETGARMMTSVIFTERPWNLSLPLF